MQNKAKMETNSIPKIMYRSEDSYGSGVRDVLDVMVYELYELGNTDILEYICDHYFDEEMKRQCSMMILSIETGDVFEDDIIDIAKASLETIKEKTNKDIRYCLWLAEKDVVDEMYAYDESNIDAYYTSDVILSDLGRDGILFGYEKEPEPIDEDLLLEHTPQEIERMPLPPKTTKTSFDGFDMTGSGNNENSLESEMMEGNKYRDYQLNKGRYPDERAGSKDEDDWWNYQDAYVAEITPQEYFDLCYRYVFNKAIPNIETDEIPGVSKKQAQEYAEMMKSGEKFLIPYINFRNENQEGRHRALAAYYAGYKTIPCLIII